MKCVSMFVVATLALAAGCKDDAPPPAPAPAKVAPATAGPVGTDGVRRIAVEANKEGYAPARISAKPGEKLVLVFTRTAEGACFAEVKVPGNELKALPLNQPVEIPVTAPASGEIQFACGMDMFHGVIVADA
ncbi:MAG: cupredoxin domain-containing protein [Kofleriaceae bacterium]